MSRGGGARLLIGVDGTEVDAGTAALLRETGCRGVVLFARNLVDAAQARRLIADLRAAAPGPLLVCVDQEGGRVVRLARGVTVFPGNLALGACDDEALAEAQGQVQGAELAALGVDLNLAPVVDLLLPPGNAAIGTRSLGADPARVAALAAALVRGQRAAGVGSCLKHFPGLGAAEVDPHVTVSRAALPEAGWEPHLAPYVHCLRDARGLAVMSTHLVAEAYDREHLATFAPAVLRRLLRGRLGFDGLLVSDDLCMGAVPPGDLARAAVAAATAGHDLVAVCHGPEGQRAAASALGRALAEGRLEEGEHARALERCDDLQRLAPGRVPERDGAALARTIARRAMHRFGDARGLLPLPPDARVLVVHGGAGVRSVVAEAPRAAGVADGEARLRALFAAWPAVGSARLDEDPSQAAIERLVARAEGFDRVVWLARELRGRAGLRFLLARACHRLADRLVLVHLRDPFDQALVDTGVTSIASFGEVECQLEATVEVLGGDLEPRGRLPAPIRP
ncbi:MAG: beta-N-acetylhexosaminidase [Planctomycetota bacterium]